ncbi:MAG: bifunctional folylpolyglutamate synthase/dihydrofolate synthase [Clostridia bacterium]|nr:bifunctional folylpolyglutamate synthase/dihydrofolate synthase [Clostridia bacterium]
MNYQEAIEYIHSINWCFCKPGLERISELCQKLGHPERDLKFIHVAGTNGKGSFCAMTESILRQAGYRTGLYTSPYIRTFHERMQVNGENISDEELAELTEYVRPVADSMTDKPTEFELITAIAFEYFRRKQCDVVVLEAGLGGRLDSTNVIETPLLSVITGIALEHTAILGDTVEQIAAEKAGIIKNGVPVLFGGDDPQARAVIEETAQCKGSSFTAVDHRALRHVRADLCGSRFDYRDRKDVFISLLGLYQPRNAATVLEGVELLRSQGLAIPEVAVEKGLRSASWHGRFERVCEKPLVIFDGAHNPQGIEQAVRSIRHYFGGKKVYLLTGVLRDKDYTEIAAMLATVAEQAFTLTPPSPRALPAEEYAAVLEQAGISARSFDTIEAAYAAAKECAKKTGTPLICLGSLYVYASLYPLF